MVLNCEPLRGMESLEKETEAINSFLNPTKCDNKRKT